MMQRAQERWRRVPWIEWMKEPFPSSGETIRVELLVREWYVRPIWSIHTLMLMPKV